MKLMNLRRKIDRIDTQIVEALNERAKIALAIGKAKNIYDAPIYVPAREKQVLNYIKTISKGPLPQKALEGIYREIMSASIALEKPLQVAYLGSEGSNSYLAAIYKFGSQVHYVGCRTIDEVFKSVENGESDLAVVPIENSVEGVVTTTADRLVSSYLEICAEVTIKIAYCLVAKCPLEKIKKIYSHPQAFAQCYQWLCEHMPLSRIEKVDMLSTTDGAKKVLKEKNAAAIVAPECAKLYKLPVIEEHIQDMGHNATRFLIVGKTSAEKTGKDKTSIVFSVKNTVGALYHMLLPFAKYKVNMTRIESRPMKKKAWDYYFFIDIEGHREDLCVKKALASIEKKCQFLRILGSYPA